MTGRSDDTQRLTRPGILPAALATPYKSALWGGRRGTEGTDHALQSRSRPAARSPRGNPRSVRSCAGSPDLLESEH